MLAFLRKNEPISKTVLSASLPLLGALLMPLRIETFCWRIEHTQIREGYFRWPAVTISRMADWHAWRPVQKLWPESKKAPSDCKGLSCLTLARC